MLWKDSSRRPGLRAMTSDLRTRLLLMLVLPLCVLALVGVWLDYRSADEAAGQHDQRLVRLLPALADSVLAPPIHDNDPPLLLLAPPIEDFLRQNAGFAAYSVRDTTGRLLLGEDAASASFRIETRYRYNPNIESLVAMVPAVIPLLLLMIPAMLAALSVVREKELGSIINLYVTPVTRFEFLL
eukprot:gene34163-45813_t